MGKRKLTREYCEKVVSTCTTIKELMEKDKSVYNAIRSHYYLDLLDRLEGRRPQKHTKETCREAALKCKTMNEFYTDYQNEYQASMRFGILSEFDWLKKNEPKEKVCIYCYEFPAIKTIYIGLTCNPKRRNKDHHGKARETTVHKFCRENGYDIPDMKILMSDLPAKTKGRRMEDKYVKKFRAAGWNVLNIAPTGPTGSIGSNAEKWTPELIWKEVYKYTLYTDFITLSEKAYAAASSRGMLPEIKNYYGNKSPAAEWTDDLIWKEVYKYNIYREFQTQSEKAYIAALRRGMLPEIRSYFGLEKIGYTKWTDDLIWKEVYKYNTYLDFIRQSHKTYMAAYHRGMLEEIKAYYAQKKSA